MTSRVHWPLVQLDDVADDMTVGYVGPMAAEYVASGVPFLRSQNVEPFRINLEDVKFVNDDFHDRLTKSALRPGDVVIVRTGRPGSAAVIPTSLPVANCSDVVIVRPGPQLDARFLMYFLNSEAGSGHVSSHLVGAVQQHFNVGSARTLRIPLPPLPEQRRVARILGALDDKIQLNRRMNRSLESIARAIFRSWFVDLDPARKTIEGGDPRPPMARAAESSEAWPESVTRQLPAGWLLGTLSDVSQLNPENWSSESVPESVVYVDLSNTKRGRIESVNSYARDKAPSRARRVLRPSDTIVGTVRPGNQSYALVSEAGLTGSTGFAVLRPTEPKYREIVYLAATASSNVETLALLADGGAYPAISPQLVADTPLVLAPHDIAAAFSRLVGPLLNRMTNSERESQILARLRDALLPHLLTNGEAATGGLQ